MKMNTFLRAVFDDRFDECLCPCELEEWQRARWKETKHDAVTFYSSQKCLEIERSDDVDVWIERFDDWEYEQKD